MGRVIKANLSVKSITDAIEQIRKYQEELDSKVKEFTKRLAEEGVQIAKANVVDLDAVFTGELLGSISSEERPSGKNTSVYVIKADSDHAIYVEIGTGMVGASSPYPGKLPVVYAQGKKFITLKESFGKYPAGTYGWFYYKNGQFFFTEGMPSRPFMYNTGVELRNKIGIIAKEVFGNG